MNFFNIDLHISVIADVKNIFTKLGHTVTDKSLSGHAFVFNRSQDRMDVISPANWRWLNSQMCDAFYQRYKDELAHYDGFICTYPPSFALLYEKFNKPIIIQVPIRFEVPFENNPGELKRFINFLKHGIDNKQILPVCNSLYDKRYCEKFTEREWLHIPNICEYTGIDCRGGTDFLLYSRVPVKANHPNVKDKDLYLGHNYQWNVLNTVKGIVHLPYNASTMSIFEQYTGNIPLLFPTPEFNMELYRRGLTLSELSWTSTKQDGPDWIALADYYDKNWMPYITYFSSFQDLRNILDHSFDTQDISNRMKAFNVERKNRVYNLWRAALETIHHV